MQNFFIEFQNFGWNVKTVSAFITVVFTFIQGYGVFSQSKKIWKKHSVETVSSYMFIVSFFYFCAFVFYALDKHSLAMLINSSLLFFYIPIVVGLFKFKRLSSSEKLSIPIFVLMIPAMIILPIKDEILTVFLLITGISMLDQPLKMAKAETRGAVEVKYAVTFLFTAIFWLIFGLAINNWIFIIFNMYAIIIYGSVVFLYFKPTKLKV